ncbi:MAG: hypothetical protein VKJ24_03710 [Synechococcales bacterium]|nr:hypothetical protein [Synechococcales bacterium]
MRTPRLNNQSVTSFKWISLTIALTITLSFWLVSCSHADSSPKPIPHSPTVHSSTPSSPMLHELTHLPIRLSLPYYPWANAYQTVRQNSILARYLDQKMIPALEAPGNPADRLRTMAQAAQAARIEFSQSGAQADMSFQGLDPVETDLRVAFFAALSQAIATHPTASKADKQAALQELLPIVTAEEPIGIPAPSQFQTWTATARITAETEIKVHLEDLTDF